MRGAGKKNKCCFKDRMKNCLGLKTCSHSDTPLSCRNNTGRIKVCKITGDRKVCARMASMGLYPGVEADIICAENGHQCILKIHGGTISLDPTITENIIVSAV